MPRAEVSTDYDELDVVHLYVQEARKYPLLLATEEITLGKAIKSGQEAQKLVENMAPQPPGLELLRQVRAGQQARQRLIQSNLRSVINIASGYSRNPEVRLPLADLIQFGNIGLVRAADGFDYQRGLRFMTYSPHWIHKEIKLGIAYTERAVRIPIAVISLINTIANTERRLQREHGNMPDKVTVAKEIGISVEKLEQLKQAALLPRSLDEVIEGTHPATQDVGEADSDELRQLLLEELDPREVDVLFWRNGLMDGDPEAQAEIRKAIGSKRGVAPQIESVAKEKIANNQELIRKLRGGQ